MASSRSIVRCSGDASPSNDDHRTEPAEAASTARAISLRVSIHACIHVPLSPTTESSSGKTQFRAFMKLPRGDSRRLAATRGDSRAWPSASYEPSMKIMYVRYTRTYEFIASISRRASRSSRIEKRRNGETEKRRNGETEKRRNGETEKRRNEENSEGISAAGR